MKTYKEISGITEEEITAIEALKSSREKFTFGALLATEAFELPDGTLAGFAKKFCSLLSELFEIDFVLELSEWDILLNALESGTIDFTGELTATDERMMIYSFTPPIAERMLRLFTRADSRIQTEADITGLKIGFLAGSITADEILATYRLPFTYVSVDHYEAAAEMIANGEIDAFVGESSANLAFSGFNHIRSQIFFPMIHSPVSMAAAKPELAPIISAVSKYIAAGGADHLYKLYKDGEFEYSKYQLSRSLTNEEKAYLDHWTKDGKTIKVAYEYDNYPVNFYNEEDGAFEGIALDVLREIGKLTGMRFEPAVPKGATWADIYGKLNAGEIHMVAQLLFSEQRRDHFLWSAVPYAQSYYALMSKSDYPCQETYQVAQATVGVMKESGKRDLFFELFPNHQKIKEYETQYDCLDALENGEIDLLMASEYMLLTQINYREKSGFKININLSAPLQSAFGFHKDDAVLCSIIDKAQQYVNTSAIEMNWLGKHSDYSRRLAEERTRLLLLFLCIMFLVLAVIVFVLTKNTKLSKKLKELANYDALTGVYNRRFFMELASFQIARSIRAGIDCFIIIFDLDHFKKVNDTYGHPAGDKVLTEVAQRVKNSIRPYDILGRYGGEEFVMLMTDIKEINRENAANAVERIRQGICKAPIQFGGSSIPVSASFGIAYAAPLNDLDAAIQYADDALYQAKAMGRNRTVFYEQKYAGRKEITPVLDEKES
ncbi:MAG: diguanylate cyclase [Clostridia bacterium]|nr:diguanylate cyclase [Clostridia bacterium]